MDVGAARARGRDTRSAHSASSRGGNGTDRREAPKSDLCRFSCRTDRGLLRLQRSAHTGARPAAASNRRAPAATDPGRAAWPAGHQYAPPERRTRTRPSGGLRTRHRRARPHGRPAVSQGRPAAPGAVRPGRVWEAGGSAIVWARSRRSATACSLLHGSAAPWSSSGTQPGPRDTAPCEPGHGTRRCSNPVAGSNAGRCRRRDRSRDRGTRSSSTSARRVPERAARRRPSWTDATGRATTGTPNRVPVFRPRARSRNLRVLTPPPADAA